MDKLAKFIDIYIPTEACNLRCSYCYIAQRRLFANKIARFELAPANIRKALSVDRLGGVCLLNMCAGGETLLSKDIVGILKELLEEGHYIMVVTNGTLTSRFQEIADLSANLLERLFFKFSFHYLELTKNNILDAYFDNIKLMQSRGCSFTVELTPCDEMIPLINDIKAVCMEKLGVLCHVTIARDDRTKNIEHLSCYRFDEYIKVWSSFSSQLFEFKAKIFYKQRKEFCYAGSWSAWLNLMSGELRQCYSENVIDNIYENVKEPIRFRPVGYACRLPHCYNGHAFLTLGVIPDLETPSYLSMRDRVGDSGAWIQPKMRCFLSQKLKDNNAELSEIEKVLDFCAFKISKAKTVLSRFLRICLRR